MSERHMVLLPLHKTVYQPHHKAVLLVLVLATVAVLLLGPAAEALPMILLSTTPLQ